MVWYLGSVCELGPWDLGPFRGSAAAGLLTSQIVDVVDQDDAVFHRDPHQDEDSDSRHQVEENPGGE